MKVVIQRVSSAAVFINQKRKTEIEDGLLVLLGIEQTDDQQDIDWLVGKIARLRIFPDDKGIMNRSIQDIDGDVIVVSQFTLHASTKKGNRPSYIYAATPDVAITLYKQFVKSLEDFLGKPIGTGEFGAMMDVKLVNSGPVTIIIDSKNRV